MLEFMVGLHGRYIYRDGYYFDEVGFIDYKNRIVVSGLTGMCYDLDSIKMNAGGVKKKMIFKTERTNIKIPTGDELLNDVRAELNDKGGLFIWTITKIVIYLLMRDQGKDEF